MFSFISVLVFSSSAQEPHDNLTQDCRWDALEKQLKLGELSLSNTGGVGVGVSQAA